jgi:hypothetical protein
VAGVDAGDQEDRIEVQAVAEVLQADHAVAEVLAGVQARVMSLLSGSLEHIDSFRAVLLSQFLKILNYKYINYREKGIGASLILRIRIPT